MPGVFIERLADEIEADYRRWSEFEKSARLASHSAGGVIELMPTSDGRLYSFKYVNGHPKNTAAGLLTVTAFGVLADVRHGLPAAAVRTDRDHGAAHRGDVGAGRTLAGARGQPRHGADRQWRAERIPGDRASIACWASASCGCSTSIRAATAKLERNLRAMPELADLRIVRTGSSAEACKGADIVTTVTADKRNAVILTPPMIAPGMHLNAVGGDCPGKTELHATCCACRTCAWSSSTSRSRASRARSSRCRPTFR